MDAPHVAGLRLRRWLALIKTATGALSVQFCLRALRTVKRMRATSRLQRAVTAVQRAWRSKRVWMAENKTNNYALLVQKCVHLFILRKKINQRREATRVIKTYLNAFQRLSPLEIAAQRFIMKIKLAQRFWRGYTAVTHARLMLLTLQWNRIEVNRLMVLNEKGGDLKRGASSLTETPSPKKGAPMTSSPLGLRVVAAAAAADGGEAAATAAAALAAAAPPAPLTLDAVGAPSI